MMDSQSQAKVTLAGTSYSAHYFNVSQSNFANGGAAESPTLSTQDNE